MSWLSRLFGGTAKAAEGAYRDGPYAVDGGWLPASSALNFWQMGQNVRPLGAHSAMVEACASAYSQTVAMCPGDHWRLDVDTGGRSRVTNSALARILRKPNEYQSISDFMLNLTRNLYDHGSAYAYAVRNDRFEISELHLMRPRACSAYVAEDGAIFYGLGGNEIAEHRFDLNMVPARNVLHVRLHTPRHPLRGESPILAAALDIAAGNAAVEQQLAFFRNQAKPSIMLSTDQVLTRDQAAEARQRFREVTTGENSGGVPVLSGGLKPITTSITASDAQLVEMLKMSDQAVALAFRVPMQILGIGGTPFASTEALMQSWVSQGLGFALNHIEEAFGQLFGLRGVPDEYVEFSTKALLRSSFKERIEGLSAGVIGGIYSPDEARAEEELPKVPGGHGAEPRVQQQVVPLSWEPPAPVAAPPPDEDEPDGDEPDAIAERLYAFSRELH